MTLTEAYEAIMKMPRRNRLSDIKEASRQESKDDRVAGTAGDMLADILPASPREVLTVITGDA